MDEFLELTADLGKLAIGGTLYIAGGLISGASEGVAEVTATAMDAHGIPGGDLVRDHGAEPIEAIGKGLEELGKAILE